MAFIFICSLSPSGACTKSQPICLISNCVVQIWCVFFLRTVIRSFRIFVIINSCVHFRTFIQCKQCSSQIIPLSIRSCCCLFRRCFIRSRRFFCLSALACIVNCHIKGLTYSHNGFTTCAFIVLSCLSYGHINKLKCALFYLFFDIAIYITR